MDAITVVEPVPAAPTPITQRRVLVRRAGCGAYDSADAAMTGLRIVPMPVEMMGLPLQGLSTATPGTPTVAKATATESVGSIWAGVLIAPTVFIVLVVDLLAGVSTRWRRAGNGSMHAASVWALGMLVIRTDDDRRQRH